MKMHETRKLLSQEVGKHYNLFVAKVEKYLLVGNKWLLEVSEKIGEQAHQAAHLLEKVEYKQKTLNLSTSIQNYLYLGKKWVVDTPERALDSAYKSALILKQIEDKYLSGDEITSISNSSDKVAMYFQVRSKKQLLLIELRMMEFKVSNFIIDDSSYSLTNLEIKDEAGTIIDKLRLIDEVLNRYYQTQQTNTLMSAESSRLEIQQTSGISEEKIFSQLGSRWKLLDYCEIPFQKEEDILIEDNIFVQDPTTVDAQPPKLELKPHTFIEASTTVDAQPPKLELNLQTKKSNPPATRYVTKNLGMASMLFAAGFITGGVCIFALTNQNFTTANTNQDKAVEMRSEAAVGKFKNTNVMPNPSTPETMSPELSFFEVNPTKLTTPEE